MVVINKWFDECGSKCGVGVVKDVECDLVFVCELLLENGYKVFYIE